MPWQPTPGGTSNPPETDPSFGSSVGWLLGLLRKYLGLSGRRSEPIVDAASLRRFLQTRASHVAQTSLYGYVRTRAGLRYPELFDDDPFVRSMNIAKWQMWLACLSDIAVYAGGLMAQGSEARAERIGPVLQEAVTSILEETGVPPDAGPEFEATARHVLERLSACDWASVEDGDAAFVESPPALVKWAPIVDELKQFDEPIVLNSVRFRWKEVRDDLRQNLDADALLADVEAST